MRVSREKRAHAMPGGEFKEVRLSLGLTQARLAAIMGISAQAVVSEMERGKRRVPDYLARHVLLLAWVAKWELVGAEVGKDRLDVEGLLRSSPLGVRS
jgi:transcriptional regulator with XRE-family HTH domain